MAPWRPGESGNPAGRPRGSRNRATIVREEEIRRQVAEERRPTVQTAEQLLRMVLMDAALPLPTRLDAARTLLGFEKARMAPAPAPDPADRGLAARLAAAQRRLANSGDGALVIAAETADGGAVLRPVEDYI